MSKNKHGWKVAFTRCADEDIRGICAFIAERDGLNAAAMLLEKFIAARDSLRELPERGRIPPELDRVNVRAFREIQVGPYRVIYQVNTDAREIYLHVVADGRRDFTELLQERLLKPAWEHGVKKPEK